MNINDSKRIVIKSEFIVCIFMRMAGGEEENWWIFSGRCNLEDRNDVYLQAVFAKLKLEDTLNFEFKKSIRLSLCVPESNSKRMNYFACNWLRWISVALHIICKLAINFVDYLRSILHVNGCLCWLIYCFHVSTNLNELLAFSTIRKCSAW